MGDLASETEALQRLLADSSGKPAILSYAVLESITNKFSKEIGHGGFGVVYLGNLRNGMVAVKKINSAFHDPDDQLFAREVTCLIKARHKNIVRFLGYCADTKGEITEYQGKYVMADKRQRLLCFEYVPNGNLHSYLEDNSHGNDWNIRYRIIKGICLGLQYLHKQNVYHLDLKPENVLLDACMEPKITDFGLSRFFNDMSIRVTQNIIGTRGYMAPEFHQEGEISSKTDVYSLGKIMKEILLEHNNRHSAENWNKPQHVDCPKMKKCIEIAQSCIDKKCNRPTIDEIIDELNKTENTSMYQISPSPASKELLHVEPRELYYPSGLNKRMPFSLQLTNITDVCVAFMYIESGKAKASSPCRRGVLAPHSTLGLVIHLTLLEAGEQAAVPEKQCKDMVLLRSTAVSKDFKDTDITIDWFSRQSGVQDVELDIFFVPPFSQPHAALCDETSQACPGSIKTELLEIYPLELRFPIEPYGWYIDSFINLTNTTNEDITFSVRATNPSLYWQKESLFTGTVSPRSTYSIMRSTKSEDPGQILGLLQILMATSGSMGRLDAHHDITNTNQLRQLYMSATAKGGKAHEAQLFAVVSNPDPKGRRIYKDEDPGEFGEIRSIDVHSMESWILTGHHKYVCLWKRGVKEQKHSIEHIKYDEYIATDFVVKFVERRKWVLSGDSFGKIRVLTTQLYTVGTFIAHKERIRSLAVHPSDPYVLSSSDDHLIKLWDWDKDWTCIREFRGHSSPVIRIAFNRKDTNTFASVSGPFSGGPGIVMIWSLHSTIPKTDLTGGFEAVDSSATIGDQQYMVTVAQDGNTVQIWDLQTEKCVHTLTDYYRRDTAGNSSDTNVVVCHPKLPLIFTGTKNGTVCIWNLNTYRLEHMVTFFHGAIKGFGFRDTEGYRVVIGCAKTLKFMEIDLQRLVGEKYCTL